MFLRLRIWLNILKSKLNYNSKKEFVYEDENGKYVQ